jgi:chromate reductase, NAD(P)H dehydrogenase (quinone)
MREPGLKPRILVLTGSARRDSIHRRLARSLVGALERHGVEATLADPADYAMPFYDADLESAGGLPPRAKALKELARRHDGFVIASPEYNGSFTALLKNMLDWISRPEPGEHRLVVFKGKSAAIATASPGSGGGKHGLRHLRELLELMSVHVVAPEVSIVRSSQAFDANGSLARPEDAATVDAAAAALASAVSEPQPAAV